MIEQVQQELIQLQTLLQKEKQADLQQYKQKTAQTSYKYRRKMGVCWYPVILEKSNYDQGERLIVRVSRSKEHLQKDSFQNGKAVSLFCVQRGGGEEIHQVDGVVNQVRDQEMMLTLNCDELPRWIHDGILGVQLLFDDNAYKEMEWALRQVLYNEDPRITSLKNIILGGAAADFNPLIKEENPFLNEAQNKALSLVNAAKDIAVIHGPPGTGKTTTLIQCVKSTLKKEHQVLICAPSNAAVDLLVERLVAQEVNVVRVGHPARVTDEALSHTLDAKIAHHTEFKTLKGLRKQAEEYFALGGKWKRNFGREEREQRKLLLTEARKLRQDAEHLSAYITSNILETCQVVACTLVGANNRRLKGAEFSTVFIDEAGQALEPACWIPILKGKRVIFAGDHLQLPPTVKSFEAAKAGLNITLFEKIMNRTKLAVMLSEQYRMHQAIMGFSNQYFYQGKLMANDGVKTQLLFPEDLPVEFIDTAGTGYQENLNPDSKSTMNAEEAQLLVQHFTTYTKQSSLELNSIGIISPYRAQVELLEDLLGKCDLDNTLKRKIKINTIDSFQGQEKEVIYLSLTRSNDQGEIGFLADQRRMNVAMTRAKKKLVIIGDSATICRNDFYQKLFDYVNEIGAYKSAFELIY